MFLAFDHRCIFSNRWDPNSINTWKEFNHHSHLLNLADQFVATDVIPDPRYFLNPLNKTEASSMAPGHDTGAIKKDLEDNYVRDCQNSLHVKFSKIIPAVYVNPNTLPRCRTLTLKIFYMLSYSVAGRCSNPGLNSNPNSIHTWKEFLHHRHLLNLTDPFVATGVIPNPRYFLIPLNKTEASSTAPGHDTDGDRHTFRRVGDQFMATDVISDLRHFLNPLNKTEASSIAPGHDTGGERHTFRRVIKMGKAACMSHSVFGISIPQHTARRDRAAYCSCAHVLGMDLNRSSR
ncbi:hypothetical protein CDAR_613961 [Caerostris darwini]|uniref:Uncharacterized protein n=1 Tax=Caerostris darwini TaxID=1538125 RepID=A0AAV4UGU7_9ARAC|nr:hypothetical protein CDAR_613961 [Caerostris darwini]